MIDEYTIYCTEGQTKKALELLGAPIKFKTICLYDLQEGKFIPYPDVEVDINGEPILIPPTAEQMIGWLRKAKGIFVSVDPSLVGYTGTYHLQNENGRWFYKEYVEGYYETPKEATLAAIDAALDYLIKNKNYEY